MIERINPIFFIDEFLSNATAGEGNTFPAGDKDKMYVFQEVCQKVRKALDKDYQSKSDNTKQEETELQKDAILGEQRAVSKLKNDIADKLISMSLSATAYPDYYRNLEEAIFHELYGLSCLAAWANDYTEEYRTSSSAKIVGDNIYCLINGSSVKLPQKISAERRRQLRQALLLGYPDQHEAQGHNEVFLKRDDGGIIRATLLSGLFTQRDQDAMVFRKYLLSDPEQLRFEVLAGYGTYPMECCKLFEEFARCGFNVIASGQVRSGKTTWLQTYQHYEDPTLEATTVSTDEETDYSKITDGPLIQIIADEEQLTQIEKTLKRLDSNYIIMSEMRTPAEYKFYLGITNMGTRRCKCTIHDNNATAFPRKMATEVVSAYGGNLQSTIAQIYDNVDFVFEMFELPTDRSKKRLKGIVEFIYDKEKDLCIAHRICKYDAKTDTWMWNSAIGEDKRDIAIGFQDSFDNMKNILKKLEEQNPLKTGIYEYPAYYEGNTKILKGEE